MKHPPLESGVSVTVVVPTFRGAGRVAALLATLENQTLSVDRFEVIVVDDSSDDGAIDAIEGAVRRAPFAVLRLRTPYNQGPAVARNLGWRQGRASVVAFLDDDCTPQPGWLEAGITAMEADRGLGVVQGRTTPPEGVSTWGLRDWYLWRTVEAAGPYFEGCNIFYRRDALERTGGFDEAIGWWGEDTSLGWQVVEAGWRRGFAAGAWVHHDLERRGWAWFVRNGLRERNVVLLAARHPGYRREAFWRPWAYRNRDAAFVAALIAAATGLRWRPALAGMLPYLWLQRPSVRGPHFLRLCVQIPVVDAARCVGQLSGAIRGRVLIV